MEEWISKKELLQKYGISYGALYRWKRKGLIPEEWFIRRSTVTGQETFFARELICARVEAILAGRDEASLDDLAKKLSGGAERDTRQLIIRTGYGERVVALEDIRSVILRDAAGEETDITELIRGGRQPEKTF